MQAVAKNPFRILGTLANASAKDIQREKARAAKFASVGKLANPQFYLPRLEEIEKLERNESNIENAFANIEQRKNKLQHSLFWFVCNNQFDEIAIEYIINDNEEKALETWEKITDGKQITSVNFSSFLNKSTLQLLSFDLEKQKKGIANKFELIYSPEFANFVQIIIDDTYRVDLNELCEYLINTIIKCKQAAKVSNENIYKEFQYCSNEIIGKVANFFCNEYFVKIDELIKNTRLVRDGNDKNKIFECVVDLASNASLALEEIRGFIKSENLTYVNLSDSVAKEIMMSSVEYYNKCLASKNSIKEDVVLLLEKALAYAKKETTKAKINEIYLDIKTRVELYKNQKNYNNILDEINKFYTIPKSLTNIEAFCISCIKELEELKERDENITNKEDYWNSSCAIVVLTVKAIVESLNDTDRNNLLLRKKKYFKSISILKKIESLDMTKKVRSEYQAIMSKIIKEFRHLEEQFDILDFIPSIIKGMILLIFIALFYLFLSKL